jgi:hypothetical protein
MKWSVQFFSRSGKAGGRIEKGEYRRKIWIFLLHSPFSLLPSAFLSRAHPKHYKSSISPVARVVQVATITE